MLYIGVLYIGSQAHPPPGGGVCLGPYIYNTHGVMLNTDYLSYYPNNDIDLFT